MTSIKGEGTPYPALFIYFVTNMSRVAFNQTRMFMRKSFVSTPTFRAFSAGPTRFQQQQQQQQSKNTTHFGFRDVAEEEKESLGKQLVINNYRKKEITRETSS